MNEWTGLENDLLGDATLDGNSYNSPVDAGTYEEPDVETEAPEGYIGLNKGSMADVKEAFPHVDFLDTPAHQWTPDQRSAYKFMLSYVETGDWWARGFDRNTAFDPTRDYSGAFDIIGIEQPAPPSAESIIARYDAENGEGAFSSLSWREQSIIMSDGHVGWTRADYHNLVGTLDNYDADGFTGYDEDATYSYAYGLEGNGNSGYQNLRPWDVEAQEMSVSELREIYNNDPNLQGTFGTADDFLNYVAEMNYAGFGNIYGEEQSSSASQNYYQNPLAQDIFNRYASDDGSMRRQYDFVHGWTATNEYGDTFKWTGSQWMPFQMAYRPNMAGQMIKMVVGAGIGLATGQLAGLAGAAGGLGGTASGALSGALSSTVGQLVVNGKVDMNQLIQAAIIGGIGGFADTLRNMDGAIANGGILGSADDIVTATSELLNIPYDEALAILEGIATGAVSGQDLESIVAGAVGAWGTSKPMDFLEGMYGDEFDVQDWFKDGASTIPVEALEPFVSQIIDGALNGTLDDPDAWLMAVWDYFQAGGDIDFMLPDGISLGDIFKGSFNFDICRTPKDGSEKPWYCNIDLSGDGWSIGDPCEDEEGREGILNQLGLCDINLPDLPDVLDCMPGFEWDVFLEECVAIPNPCGEGLIWDMDLGECIPDIPKPPCLEGEEWDEILQKCVKIPNPCGEGLIWDIDLGECVPDIPKPPCLEGEEWDELLQKCVKIPNPCGEGLIWDMDLGECIPKPKCLEGEEWDQILQKCVKIPNPCGDKSGLIWDADLGECVPDIPKPPCLEGEEWDELLQKCVKIPNPCGEGLIWDADLGECVPDIIDCMDGFEWDDILEECIPKPKCLEGEEWDQILNKCVRISNPCGDKSGLIWDADLGECVPDVIECVRGFKWDDILKRCVEIEDPDVDVEGPDVEIGDPCEEGQVLNEAGLCEWPDLPPPPATAQGMFDPKWTGLFEYTTVTKPELSKYAPQLSQARGMIDDLFRNS